MEAAETVIDRSRRRLWQTYVTDVARDADEASGEYVRDQANGRPNLEMASVLIVVALSLTIINFYAKRYGWVPGFAGLFGSDPASVESALDNSQLGRFAIWTGVQLIAYVGLPLILIVTVFKRPVRDFGLRIGGVGAHWRIYAVLFALSAPFIVWVSYSAAFQAKYPFYNLAPGEGLWPGMSVWWIMYALQFVALEFFFRGFMIHGLKWRLGYAAIFVMVVPYNMIHFEKPLIEAIGAIAGGITLGTLSLKTRSIWWGAALHIAVAGTMDLLSLYQKGLL